MNRGIKYSSLLTNKSGLLKSGRLMKGGRLIKRGRTLCNCINVG